MNASLAVTVRQPSAGQHIEAAIKRSMLVIGDMLAVRWYASPERYNFRFHVLNSAFRRFLAPPFRVPLFLGGTRKRKKKLEGSTDPTNERETEVTVVASI
ncbi:unnamed protein product [Nippostrongylus brasiliensis]|uniref:Target of rapamycin (TOR) kinase 1 n=1 Tax=Nippostrongylus brasiliensis TaxID=27835 RepID=A0A0N4XVX9_NIPBR|nr:unnamed protein product [Nippostrongylus brasiliensis]